MAMMFGFFAVASIAFGAVCASYKRYLITFLFGCFDMLFTFVSLLSFKDMLIESGKRLTVDWLGLGYYKQAFAMYAVVFLFGVALMLFGVYRKARNLKIRTK